MNAKFGNVIRKRVIENLFFDECFLTTELDKKKINQRGKSICSARHKTNRNDENFRFDQVENIEKEFVL